MDNIFFKQLIEIFTKAKINEILKNKIIKKLKNCDNEILLYFINFCNRNNFNNQIITKEISTFLKTNIISSYKNSIQNEIDDFLRNDEIIIEPKQTSSTEEQRIKNRNYKKAQREKGQTLSTEEQRIKNRNYKRTQREKEQTLLTERLNIKITKSNKNKLLKLKEKNNKSMQFLINQAIENYKF